MSSEIFSVHHTPYFPLQTKPFTFTMIEAYKFHKDQWGTHVYYAGKGGNPSRSIDGLMLNDKIEFDLSKTCVVPPVKRLSVTKTELQVVGMLHEDGKQTMTVAAFDAKRHQLTQLIDQARADLDMTTEVSAEVEKRQLESDWTADHQDVEVDREFDFEIIDIEYPADERLVPMRHLPGAEVNYFTVDGEQVACNMLNKLCQGAGLTKGRKGIRSYHMEDYNHRDVADRINIEGKSYSEGLRDVKLHSFTGHVNDCRKYINDVEMAARKCFDLWRLDGKTARGLSVGFVTDHLETIKSYVRRIESKKKTERQQGYAVDALTVAINEVKALGMQELIDEDEYSEEETHQEDILG